MDEFYYDDDDAEQAFARNADDIERATGWDVEELRESREWGAVGVMPVAQTRDSGAREQSQFGVALAELKKVSADHVCVVRFGHWGYGWVENIAFDTTHAGVLAKATGLAQTLSVGEFLDESDISRRESEEVVEYIRQNTHVPQEHVEAAHEYLCAHSDVHTVDDVNNDKVIEAMRHVPHAYEDDGDNECWVCLWGEHESIHVETQEGT